MACPATPTALTALEGLSQNADKLGRPKRPEEPYLMRAALWTERKQLDKAREALEAGLKSLPKEAALPLVLSIAQISLSEGKLDQARKELSRAHDLDPANLSVVQLLAELAIGAKDFAAAEQWETQVKNVEGDGGTQWRYLPARRLVQQAKDAKDPMLAEAAGLQAAVQQRRAAWGPAHLLRAQIAVRQGDLEGAVEAYQEAVRLGEQRPEVVGGLVSLLTELRRFTDAERYLSRLQDQVRSSPAFASLEINGEVQTGQLDQALKTAQAAVTSQPKNPAAQILLGRMLLANGKQAEAEAAFRKAVDLAPEESRGYAALFVFYLQTRQPKLADQTLKDLDLRAKLPDSDKALLLAEGYRAVGDRKNADAKFQEAERLAPKSAVVQERRADYLTGSDLDAAEKALRRAMELDPQSATARRRLAGLLVARGGESKWQEALRLLESTGGPGGAGTDDTDRRAGRSSDPTRRQGERGQGPADPGPAHRRPEEGGSGGSSALGASTRAERQHRRGQ